MKYLLTWFQSLSRFQQIGISVLASHAAVLLTILILHMTEESFKSKKPIAIRTILAPSLEKKGVVEIQTKKRPINTEKKVNPAQPITSSSFKKKAEQVKESELLLKIAESLNVIAETPKVSNQTKFIPALPPSIELLTPLSSLKSTSYSETVSTILQNCLDLPEFGEVIAKIEINSSGKVTECEILKTRSQKNANFLRKRLQELTFPCFNEFGLTDAHLNFTITFCNVENR